MKKNQVKKMKFYFGLKAKLLLLFLILAGLPILFFTIQAQSIVKTRLEEQAADGIESDARFIISSINLWTTRNETELLRITDPNSVLTTKFRTYKNEPNENNKRSILETMERSLFNTPTYLELAILDKDSNEIIIATNPNLEGNIGLRKLQDKNVATRKRSSHIFYSEHLQDYTMTIENPIKDEAGEALGVVAIFINIQSLKPIILSTSTTHQEGDIYLVTPEEKGIIRNITPSFPEFMKNKLVEEYISEYTNYEGKEVIGYHGYLEDLDVFFIDEHDKKALFKPLRELNAKIWLLASLSFLLASIVAFFLIDRFTKPIKNLTSTAQRISEGHYELRAKTRTHDEIGVLSDSFNRMANSLTTSLNDLSVKNALMEAQYNASLFGQLSVGANGEILTWNKAYEEIWEIPKSLLDKRDTELLVKQCAKKTKDPAEFTKKTTEFIRYKKRHSNDVIEMRNGKVIDRHSTPLLDEKKNVLGRIFVCRDITKEVETNKTKNEFVSLATHQLQTPLTAIRWSLENLDKMIKKGEKTKKTLIEEASQSTERVIQLVADMLNVSRLDTGMIGINSSNTNVTEMLERSIEEAREAAKHKQISIKLKKPRGKVMASLDTDLISEVIQNLLSNAIRFSEPKKNVTVTLQKKDKHIEITVKDEGIGISKKDQKELFTKFFRSDQANRYNTTGSGLGLYVIKKILDACEGSIRMRSTEGRGSTFTVILPLKGPIQIKEGAKVLIHKGITI